MDLQANTNVSDKHTDSVFGELRYMSASPCGVITQISSDMFKYGDGANVVCDEVNAVEICINSVTREMSLGCACRTGQNLKLNLCDIVLLHWCCQTFP
jgi:hypothetical protein